MRKFQEQWCLDDVSGSPRNFGSLVVSAMLYTNSTVMSASR